jgi:hypothetical protein
MKQTPTAPAWAKIEALPKFKRGASDGQYIACCPAHEDRNPSLSIGVGDDGQVLLACHAGCDTATIVGALGCAMADLFPPKQSANGATSARRIVATYDYFDAQGILVCQAVRYQPKDFKRRRPDGKGGWIWNLGGLYCVPYRMPYVLMANAAEIVYLVEGEKDADRLASLGLVATTTIGGANALAMTSHTLAKSLAGRRVVIVQDMDAAGDKYAAAALKVLKPVAAAVAILQLPRLAHVPSHDEDVSDWLDKHGGTVDELRALAEDAITRTTHEDDVFNEDKAPATQQPSLSTLNTSRFADWPDPMGDAAYIGPIGNFVKRLAPETEAAKESLLIQALVMAGNAMGRHGHVTAEADEHHTNLYAVVVGGTGARKGTALGQVRRFVKRADEAWVQEHIVNGLSTGEGLINAVRDDEPAIPDKVALAVETEFASVFKVKGRDGNTLSTVLRQARDGDELQTLTRQSPLKATGTHISIIGHITPDELRRMMSETDANNGFGNRILWICANRANFLPDGGNDVNLNAEVEGLRRAIDFAKKQGRMCRDEEAKKLWRKRYRDLTTGRPGLLGAVTNRAEAQVTRLSLLYALLDCSPDIKKEHLEAALAVWDYCLASAKDMLRPSFVLQRAGARRTRLHDAARMLIVAQGSIPSRTTPVSFVAPPSSRCAAGGESSSLIG